MCSMKCNSIEHAKGLCNWIDSLISCRKTVVSRNRRRGRRRRRRRSIPRFSFLVLRK